jgi:transcriptional regulator GlxA family with amidase domain
MDVNLMDSYRKIVLFNDYLFLVSENFRSKHKVYEYAEMLHVSPKTLVNTFAKLDLPKPIDILHGKLVMESITLIADSDKPINQLAAEVGYFDLDSFSRCFKHKTGLSPRNFRRSFQNTKSSDIKELVSPEIYSMLSDSIEKK